MKRLFLLPLAVAGNRRWHMTPGYRRSHRGNWRPGLDIVYLAYWRSFRIVSAFRRNPDDSQRSA